MHNSALTGLLSAALIVQRLQLPIFANDDARLSGWRKVREKGNDTVAIHTVIDLITIVTISIFSLILIIAD